MDETFEPDIFDLNDWLVQDHPETYEAIKYLQGETFYKLALIFWKEKGKPEIWL